jgi:hypothetical protein
MRAAIPLIRTSHQGHPERDEVATLAVMIFSFLLKQFFSQLLDYKAILHPGRYRNAKNSPIFFGVYLTLLQRLRCKLRLLAG